MRVPPINYNPANIYINSLSARKHLHIVQTTSFKAAGNKTAKVGAGLMGAFVGAAAGFCFAGPIGALAGGAILGGLSVSAQESENKDLNKSDNSTMFDGRDESSKI